MSNTDPPLILLFYYYLPWAQQHYVLQAATLNNLFCPLLGVAVKLRKGKPAQLRGDISRRSSRFR